MKVYCKKEVGRRFLNGTSPYFFIKLRRSQGFFTLASSVLLWWTQRDLNPRPLRCERSALPAELRAQIGAFYTKKVAEFGFLKYSIFRGKVQRIGLKNGATNLGRMCLTMDANRALSQLSYRPKSTLFMQKSCEFWISQIFIFRGKVQQIGQKNGEQKIGSDVSQLWMRTVRSPS